MNPYRIGERLKYQCLCSACNVMGTFSDPRIIIVLTILDCSRIECAYEDEKMGIDPWRLKVDASHISLTRVAEPNDILKELLNV